MREPRATDETTVGMSGDELARKLDMNLPFMLPPLAAARRRVIREAVEALFGAREEQAHPLHLVWRGHGLEDEWVDDRCGCAYHPDDPNGHHGGGPHVHPCDEHDPEQTAHEPQEPS